MLFQWGAVQIGGPYWQHGYHACKGVDLVVLLMYVPGCPPRPEALIQGVLELQKKIKTETPFRKSKKMENKFLVDKYKDKVTVLEMVLLLLM